MLVSEITGPNRLAPRKTKREGEGLGDRGSKHRDRITGSIPLVLFLWGTVTNRLTKWSEQLLDMQNEAEETLCSKKKSSSTEAAAV